MGAPVLVIITLSGHCTNPELSAGPMVWLALPFKYRAAHAQGPACAAKCAQTHKPVRNSAMQSVCELLDQASRGVGKA